MFFNFKVAESAVSSGFTGGMVALLCVTYWNVDNYSVKCPALSIKISWICTSLKRNVGFKSSEYEISSCSEKLRALLDDFGGRIPESVY